LETFLLFHIPVLFPLLKLACEWKDKFRLYLSTFKLVDAILVWLIRKKLKPRIFTVREFSRLNSDAVLAPLEHFVYFHYTSVMYLVTHCSFVLDYDGLWRDIDSVQHLKNSFWVTVVLWLYYLLHSSFLLRPWICSFSLAASFFIGNYFGIYDVGGSRILCCLKNSIESSHCPSAFTRWLFGPLICF
jgi:hypothetical protein